MHFMRGKRCYIRSPAYWHNSQVRNERNKARDEAKQLRTSLEAAIKESNSYKREKNELESQINQLKSEMEKTHMLLLKHAGQFNGNGNGVEEPERDGRDNSNCSPDISSDGLKNVNSEDGLVAKLAHRDIEEYILQGAVPKHVIDSLRSEEDRRNSAEERRLIQQLSKDEYDEDHLMQQVSMLQLKLDESRKNTQTEREYVLDRNPVQFELISIDFVSQGKESGTQNGGEIDGRIG